jgi:Sec-independent protein translocase protein TatA
MEVFNIGPWELILIIVLALVVFGPERMVRYSKEAAILIRRIIRSPFWRELVSTSEEIKTIPRQLVKDADLDESMREISQLRDTIKHPIRLDVPENDKVSKENTSPISGKDAPDRDNR